MADLIINQEQLQTAQTKYSEYAQQMDDLRKTLKDAVDNIRDSWQSEAGEVFFSKFDEDWEKNVKDYVNVLNHMADNMLKANTLYEEVFDAAEALKV